MQAFHVVTLSKYQALPASHIVYYSLYTAAVVGLLAVQRSGHPAYVAWRDWVQVRAIVLAWWPGCNL